MFAAFTDWEFDGNIEIAKKLAADFWPQMKAAGASRFRGTQTVPNLLGSMTPWRTREQCEAALDEIRAAGSSQSGMKVGATASRNLKIELDKFIG